MFNSSTAKLLNRHQRRQGLVCPVCFDFNPRLDLHKFKSSRALSCHIKLEHRIPNEKFDAIRAAARSYTDGCFLELCYARGVLV